ncbi:acyltransferase family protein [Paraburkholderia sediminicola]|uniref:acyltransferase family protein n=1 Tax=Paraburkholderia sediminicola TaxID=458836 RepID=UPI0038B920AE
MQPRKLEFIDALRGIAALYVLIYHLSLITSPAAVAPRWFSPISGDGGAGVMLFFVVSAFTLCLSMESRKLDESTPLLNFYLRRFFRIAPLFYVWIIIYCIRDALVFGVVHSPRDVAESLFFVLNFIPGHEQGFVWASWTIGAEMAFYVIFPLIFRLSNNLGKAGCMFFVTLLIQTAWGHFVSATIKSSDIAGPFYSMGVLHALPNFMLGVIAFHIYRLIDHSKAHRLGIGYLLIGAFCWLFYGLVTDQIFPGIGDSATIQGAFFTILLLGTSITAPSLIVNRFTRFFGKISYSVYLSHATILYFMSGIFAFYYRHMPLVTFSYALSLATGLLVITPISYLTYRFVETPGNRMGRTVINAIARKKDSGNAAVQQ